MERVRKEKGRRGIPSFVFRDRTPVDAGFVNLIMKISYLLLHDSQLLLNLHQNLLDSRGCDNPIIEFGLLTLKPHP